MGKKTTIKILAVCGAFLCVSEVHAAMNTLTDEQCASLMRRLEVDGSVYVGPAERECLSRRTSLMTGAGQTSFSSPSTYSAPSVSNPSPPSPSQTLTSSQPSGAQQEEPQRIVIRPVIQEESKSEPTTNTNTTTANSAENDTKTLFGAAEHKEESSPPSEGSKNDNPPLTDMNTDKGQTIDIASVVAPKTDLVIQIQPGLLSQRVSEFLRDNGWKTFPGWWEAENDYQVLAPYTVVGKDVEDVLGQILYRYRLKAKLYKWDQSVRVYSVEQGF